MSRSCFAIIVVAVVNAAFLFPSCSQQYDYQISVKDLKVNLSREGNITGVSLGTDAHAVPVHAYNQLAGTRIDGEVVMQKIDGGGMSFIKTLIHDSLNASCVVTEKFIPVEKTGSIRWEIEIRGAGEPWGTSINTVVNYPSNKSTRFWTTWGGPQFDQDHIDSNLRERVRLQLPHNEETKNDVTASRAGDWADPLVPLPFSDVRYYYGGPYLEYKEPYIAYMPFQHNIFSIPMCSVLEDSLGVGLTVALSPEDEIINLFMDTREDGAIVFGRLHNRISQDRTVNFALDLVAGENDWRGGLQWMSNRYPSYFNPKNPDVAKVGGTGAYSNHLTDFDVEKMKKMAFTVNWQASFDFPYMGMFIPPVGDDAQWNRYGGGVASVKGLSNYAAEMKAKGFYVFNYFNVTEFGANIKPLSDTVYADAGPDAWKSADNYLNTRLSSAILRIPQEMDLSHSIYPKSKNGGMHYTWGDGVILDCGDSAYKDFLLSQARRHVAGIPASYGICIDRMDWLRFFNEQADDGVSWFEGKKTRSLVTSWKGLMQELGPIFHDAGKSILVNNHYKRVDLMNEVDGIFDEFTYAGAPLNTTALLCINKPALGWTSSAGDINELGPDKFFQKYLYMGVYPMCPFPGNDHSIHPSPDIDKLYLEYGPAMIAMKERKWVLEPHVIRVSDNAAKANIFSVPNGFFVPVVYAREGVQKVAVTISHKDAGEINSCVVYHPGKDEATELTFQRTGNSITLDVPIERGCGIVVLNK